MSRRRLLHSPAAVAAAVAVPYVVWLAWLLAAHEAADAATVGQRWLAQGDGSPAIERLDGAAESHVGYDGQWSLFIALDPTGANGYLDTPEFRYGRILLPITARLLALGSESVVPLALLLVGLLSALGGTLALATLLARRSVTPWWAAAFGLSPGLFFAFSRDLTEPLAYGLVAAGLLAFETLAGSRRVAAAGLLLALAGLARESALVFAIALAAALLLEREGRVSARLLRSGALLALAIVPLAALKLGLALGLDSTPGPSGGEVPSAVRPSLAPLNGLVGDLPASPEAVKQLLAVAAPALLLAGAVAVASVRGGWRSAPPLALALNVLVLVVLLPARSWGVWDRVRPDHVGCRPGGYRLRAACGRPSAAARRRPPGWRSCSGSRPWYELGPLALRPLGR